MADFRSSQERCTPRRREHNAEWELLGTGLKPNKPTALENVGNERIENDQSLRSSRSQKVPGKVHLLKSEGFTWEDKGLPWWKVHE